MNMTLCLKRQTISLRPFLLFLLIFAVAISAHAIIKHGIEAKMVYECFDRKGPIQIWLQPDGRTLYVCEVKHDLFGIVVEEHGRPITAFIKNKMHSIEQVMRYISNKGAQLIWSR